MLRRFHAEAVRKARRRLFGELFEQRLQFGVAWAERCPGTNLQRPAQINVGVERDLERQVDLRLAPAETRRHHAHDPVGLVHQLDVASHNRRIAIVVSSARTGSPARPPVPAPAPEDASEGISQRPSSAGMPQ